MKKTLSILLALVLLLTSLGSGAVVFAKEKVKTVNVEYSVYNTMFLMEPTVLEVSADLSDKYAAEVGYNDSSEEPTILDATIAAHLYLFGEDFSSYAPLNVSEQGWLNNAFGDVAYSTSYRLNGAFANGLRDTVADGNYIEFMFYSDTTYYSDAYACFNTRSASSIKNKSITLMLSTEGYDSSWNTVNMPAANANITVDGEIAGKTDKNGKITLTFDKVGTYKISAENNIDGAPIFAPWCVINVSTELLNYVNKETKGAAQYLLNGTASFDVSSSVDYLTFLKSGYDMSAYNDGFVASVKANLDENGGKLFVNGYENITAYGAVIQALELLGHNTENFEGYNIVSAFESFDVDLIPPAYNPYLFRVAIEAAKDEKFGKALCDKLIDDHYVMGSGLNNWGFSCDNTAHFLTSIAKYKDYFSNYVEDAKAIIKSYTKENGAYCDAQWAPDVNADSTALAMMAFASVGDVETAFTYYKNLVENFESESIGVFGYSDYEDNAYATKDALLSLEYFKDAIEAQGFEHNKEVIKTTVKKATTKNNGSITKTCAVCGKQTKTTIYYPETVKLSKTSYTYTGEFIHPAETVTASNGKAISSKNYSIKYSKNKNVGTATVTITFKGNYSGSVTRTFKINPKGTKLTSVSANKKGFTAKWSKQSTQTSGYQIRYSTNKNFKTYTTKTVSGNKTISKKITGLKANKKYYVKIRTYKTVDSVKYYSSWSNYKTVTTK